MKLDGKTALVTGASRGIGRGVALALAEAGADVLCVSTRPGGCDDVVAACTEMGSTARAFAADLGDPAAVTQLAGEVLDVVPKIDILVNNAGITRDGLFMRMSVEDFDSVVAVNLRGAFLLCQAFARPMSKARAGRIVNVGSIVGLTGNAGQTNYAASKAGLVGFTKSLAQELGSRGITANVVAPGFIETDMTAELSDEIKERSRKNIPLGRLGTVQDVAGAVCFLCSDAAAYITGQVLVVDGGMTM